MQNIGQAAGQTEVVPYSVLEKAMADGRITFKDVAGIDEAKQELEEVVIS